MKNRSKLIVVEGTDGAGKATQSKLLKESLEQKGYSVGLFSFPQYDKTFFGKEVGNYLNGDYGDRRSIDPRLIQLLYAGDRFQAKEALEEALEKHDFVICDRYSPSSLGYRLAKYHRRTDGPNLNDKQLELLNWCNELEFKVFGNPEPDLILFLYMPVDVGTKLVEKKDKRAYTDKTKDLHESDLDYLVSVNSTFYKLAQEFPDTWSVIPCCNPDAAEGDVDSVFSIETIQKFIMTHINWCIDHKWHFNGGVPLPLSYEAQPVIPSPRVGDELLQQPVGKRVRSKKE